MQEIYGIGVRMEQRLSTAPAFSPSPSSGTPFQLRWMWGGINGVLFHQMLHGVDIQPPSSRFSKSIGHQHVLEPELRTRHGPGISLSTCSRRAERLRRGDYYCGRLGLGLHLSWVADLGGWWDETMRSAFRKRARPAICWAVSIRPAG